MEVGKVSVSSAATRVRVANSPRSNLPLKLPAGARPRTITDPALQRLKEQALSGQTAAEWRQVAERAVKVADYATAQSAYQREAELYRAKGYTQAALAEEAKANLYKTDLQLFVLAKPEQSSRMSRLEPVAGCFVGAFIDRDDNLDSHHWQSQKHGDIPQFNKKVGKEHASFFMYRGYGSPFPYEWAQYVKSQGSIPHIAWEPGDIDEVKDDGYLENFLADAARLDHPVILRFASEMNGEWTRYSRDPVKYRAAFRLVYQKSRLAPKVALMWCPNTVPQASIKDYYPGDDAVDWVGVNFYSVPFLDNDPKRPGDKIHPVDHLDFVYRTYSATKPIAIGEWAASHQSALSPQDFVPFAQNKIAQLYSALPTKYPRVKLVSWYDCNNIRHARAERKLNNFLLTEPEPLLTTYRESVASDYFLGAGESAATKSYHPLQGEWSTEQSSELRIYLKSYDPRPRVYFSCGEKVIHASDNPLQWYLTKEQLQGDKDLVTIAVFDSANRFVTSQTVSLKSKKNIQK